MDVVDASSSAIKNGRSIITPKEVKLLKRFHHSSILAISHLAKDDEMVIEIQTSMFDIGTAEQMLNASYPQGLPKEALVQIIARVVSGVEYLHQKGVIHRAIKASNIWMNTNGGIVLAGFHHAIDMSECNKWIGVEDRVYEFDESLYDVLAWLAPEVLKQDLDGYCTKSDIYSVGILSCELGNGFAPFAEMEPMQMLFEKIHGSTPFLIDPSAGDASDGERRAAFSNEFRALVDKCLIYSPDERPSAAELAKELDKFDPFNTKWLLEILPPGQTNR